MPGSAVVHEMGKVMKKDADDAWMLGAVMIMIYTLSNGSIPKAKVSCTRDIVNVSTILTPFCLSSSPPSRQPNFIKLPSLSGDVAHLAMLFILHLTHTASSECQMKNK